VELKRLNRQQFDKFRDFVYKKSGIRIDEHKVTLLSNRIRRRLNAVNCDDFDVYYQHVTSPAGMGELECFLDAITTNETFFFRTAKHFDWLKNELITNAVAQQRAGERSPSLRIWSAGCANGAEPYSIAICLAENKHRLRNWSLKVLGTDISEDILREARNGIFRPSAIESVTDEQRRRNFRHLAEDDLWQVRTSIKQVVEFSKHNLMRPLPVPAFDCIFIRNVLIYFDRTSKQVVLKNLLNALADGGYLVVGPSEGIYDMLDPLRKVAPLVYQNVRGISQPGAPRVRGDTQP
jgi:chemotaxis protein methyltransferase CheR